MYEIQFPIAQQWGIDQFPTCGELITIMLYQFPTCGELKLSLLWRNEIMLYQFPTCGGLKFKILCAIWECQSFTKEKKGLGKIPHLSLVAKPLVTHGEFYFSPLVASPLRGEKSNPFFSSVKDWVNASKMIHAVSSNKNHS